VQNSRDVVRFDGVDDTLQLLTGLNIARNVNGLTIFCVFKWNTNPTTNKGVVFISTGTNQSLGRATLAAGVTSRKMYCAGRRLDSNSFQGVTSSADNPTLFFLQTGVFNYENSILQQFIDGQSSGFSDTFQTNGATSNTDSINVQIGSASPNANTFSHADLAEILIFPTALSTTDRQKVESYLASKWGITLA
jgi:hypothetical protein